MEDAGLVSRSTPYVAGATSRAGDAWAQEAASAGAKGTQQILAAGPVKAPADVTPMLGLESGATVIARRRLILADDQPVELADAFYPIDIAGGTPLAQPEKIKGGTAGWLAEHGHNTHRVHEEIAARLPSADEQEALRIGPHDPVLVLRRASYDKGGRVFEAAVMTMRADHRVLAYDLDNAA